MNAPERNSSPIAPTAGCSRARASIHTSATCSSSGAKVSSMPIAAGSIVTPAGAPIGVQLVGPALGEALLVRAGAAFQSATDWHRRHPTLS